MRGEEEMALPSREELRQMCPLKRVIIRLWKGESCVCPYLATSLGPCPECSHSHAVHLSLDQQHFWCENCRFNGDVVNYIQRKFSCSCYVAKDVLFSMFGELDRAEAKPVPEAAPAAKFWEWNHVQ